MDSQEHPRFRNTQDWFNFITPGTVTSQELANLRFNCYQKIEKLRARPLLVYCTKLIGAPPNAQISIDLSDIEGFTDLINSIPLSEKSVDIILQSPGGSPDATERIVNILRCRFSEVHFLIPHSAYSAATMLALAGESITMHTSATLGPIDPQLPDHQYGYVPARSIKRGFEKLRDIIKTEGPESLPAYIPLIEKYSLHLLELCDDSENLSKLLVTEWLSSYMFKDQSNPENINKIVEYFSAHDTHLTHSRPLFFQKIKDFGLSIYEADGELKELLWETYILINGFFSISPFIKLFENNYGISWGRQQMSVQSIQAQQNIIPEPINLNQ